MSKALMFDCDSAGKMQDCMNMKFMRHRRRSSLLSISFCEIVFVVM